MTKQIQTIVIPTIKTFEQNCGYLVRMQLNLIKIKMHILWGLTCVELASHIKLQ